MRLHMDGYATNQASGIQSINTSAFTGTKTAVSALDPRTCIELPRLLQILVEPIERDADYV